MSQDPDKLSWLRRILLNWSDFVILFNIISITLTGIMTTVVFWRSLQINAELRSMKLEEQLLLLKQEDQHLEEQQTRIIQALDNTYNLIQEHIRLHNRMPEKGPPALKLEPESTPK